MKSVRECAMDLLAQREHTATELQRKLRIKGFAVDEIAEVIAQLQAQDLQSDARFAQAFVQSRLRHGHGPRRIAMELAQRGVAGELIDQHVWSQPEQWRECLQDVVAKRYGSNATPDMKEKAKRMRFLMQRGFELEDIREVL